MPTFWLLSSAVVLGLAPAARAVNPAVWTSSTTGSVDGIGFTVSDAGAPGLLDPASVGFADGLVGADFAVAPLPSPLDLFDYSTGSDWTITFDSPVSNLLLYVVNWRGTASQTTVPPDVVYSFDEPFQVISGLGAASVSGGDTVLTLPDSGFHHGILLFEQSLETLSLTSSTASASHQELTLAVPEAGAFLAGVAACASLVLLARRSKRTPRRATPAH